MKLKNIFKRKLSLTNHKNEVVKIDKKQLEKITGGSSETTAEVSLTIKKGSGGSGTVTNNEL